MTVTEEDPSPDVSTVSRQKEKLGLSPLAEVLPPGAGSVFGRGFFRRLIGLGWSALAYLALMAVGIGIFLFGLAGTAGPYEEALQRSYSELTYRIVLGFGAVFFLLVLRALQVELNRRRGKPVRPDRKGAGKEPWTWDHPWSTTWMPPMGQHFESSILGRVTFFAVVALCNALWLTGMRFFHVFVTLLDLLALFILYRLLRKGVQSVRFRTPVVIWEEIPVHQGGRLRGRIAFPRDVRATGPTRLTLRCVQENQTAQNQEVYAIYRETREVPLPGKPGEPHDVLSFSFEVPGDLPGNGLLKKEPVYWQVAVEVPVAGPDLEVAFLAPVYPKRG